MLASRQLCRVRAGAARQTAPLLATRRLATQHEAFEIEETQRLQELAADATVYTHRATGARLMSLRADHDTNKVFGVAFRTPPDDSSGVAHILEHSVLCGSDKYPLKEPFVELLKSSLKTFLNAMTYPDRTVYPVASTNLADFYNLTDVYLDAVLRPKLHPLVFQQEGWSLQVADDGALSYKGVVFNEMKGVYSSPDMVNYMAVQHSLFPDNVYGLSSGGDPGAIPDLTYDAFKAFHRQYYHPSNALLFFYGDDPEDKRLDIAEAHLSAFARNSDAEATAIGLQPALPAPREVTVPYPATSDGDGGGGDGGADKHFATVGWVLHHDGAEPLDSVTRLGLSVLDHLLLGTPSSTLRKALTDSNLGESVSGSGFGDDLAQPTYDVGLSGIQDAAHVPAVQELVLSTLESVAAPGAGFSGDHISASLSTLEFRLREFATDSDFPKGVMLFLGAASAFNYRRNELKDMQYEETLTQLKQRIRDDPRYFQDLIHKYLLNNSHRVFVHTYPDHGMASDRAAAEQQRLDGIKTAATADDLVQYKRDADALLERQAAVDPPELLALVPSLSVSDLNPAIRHIPQARAEVVTPAGHAVTTLHHEQASQGIGYVKLAFDTAAVPNHLVPLLPLFSRCLTGLGTSETDEVAMGYRVGTHTGGLSASPSVLDVPGSPQQVLSHLKVSAKALQDRPAALFDILAEFINCPAFNNPDRVAAFIRDDISAHESGVLMSGHQYAAVYLNSGLSAPGWMSEQMGGVAQLKYLRSLLKRVETDWHGVHSDLMTLLHTVVTSDNCLASLTGDSDTLTAFDKELTLFLKSLPSANHGPGSAVPREFSPLPAATALVVPTQVNYVVKGAHVYDGVDVPGSADVASSFLYTSWLWEQVRVQGGAYGGMCSLNRQAKTFKYMSYRDPNLLRTLQVYDDTAAFLRKDGRVTDDDVRKAVLSTVGSMDAPLSPASAGSLAMTRFQLGITEDDVQRRRDQMLATSTSDFLALADQLDVVRDNGVVVAVASPDAVDAATGELTFDRVTVFE